MSQKDVARTVKWLDRTRRFDYVAAEPFELLATRLAARARARLVAAPLVVVASGLMVWGYVATSSALGQPDWPRVWAPWVLATYGVVAVYVIVLGELGARADRQISLKLSHRASRGVATSIWDMLGRGRAACLVVIVACEGFAASTLVVERQGWVAWTFLGAFLAACTFAGIGVGRALSRAAIAVDPVSLRVDEQLRSQEAYLAAGPLYLLVYTVPLSAVPSERLFSVLLLLPLIIGGLWLVGTLWRPALRPASDAVGPSRSGGLG